MKKTKTIKKEVIVCDFCKERELSSVCDICALCKRDICYTCCHNYKDIDQFRWLIGMKSYLCDECFKVCEKYAANADKYLERIKATIRKTCQSHNPI